MAEEADGIATAMAQLGERLLSKLPATSPGSERAAQLHAALARRFVPALGAAGFEHLILRAWALTRSEDPAVPPLGEGALAPQLERAWRALERSDAAGPVRVQTAVALRLSRLLASLIGAALVRQLLEKDLPLEAEGGAAPGATTPDEATAERVLERVLAAALDARDEVRSEQVRTRSELQARHAVEGERGALQSEAQQRERLVAILGHDLGNPLLSILLTVEKLLGAGGLPPELARTLERMLLSAERMRDLVTEVIEFAGVRREVDLRVHARPMELEPLCRQLLAEVETGRGAAGRFHCRFHGDLGGFWDPVRIAQIVSNLAGNALTHGDCSPVRFDAVGEATEVVIEIQNQGEPIPPGLLPFIFEPYRQGPDQGRHGGLGLGLYIAFQLVAAHGGSLSVRSSHAEGTTFTIRLPRRARSSSG